MDDSQRQTFGFMAVAVAFTIAGEYLKAGQKGATAPNPFKVILGGTVATAFLVLAEEFDPIEGFARGLAVLALLTALFIEGGPVWTAIAGQFTQQKTPAPTRPTGPTVAGKV